MSERQERLSGNKVIEVPFTGALLKQGVLQGDNGENSTKSAAKDVQEAGKNMPKQKGRHRQDCGPLKWEMEMAVPRKTVSIHEYHQYLVTNWGVALQQRDEYPLQCCTWTGGRN